MTAWRMIDHDALRSLVTAIKDTSWTWRPDAVGELCQRMGWKLVDIDDRGGFADAGWDLGGDDIAMAFRDGYVDDITMRITQIVREPADRDRFLGDAFADAVAVVTSVLGEPTARDLAAPATVRWRMADSTVVVGRYKSSAKLTWASNRFQDRWDAVTEALS
jgi:hypothetical protein